MADTTFVAQSTTVLAAWLNVINNWIYRGANPNYVTSTGAANTYTVTLPATSLATTATTGMTLTFKAHQTNTTAATITVVGGASIGPTAIQQGAAALGGNEIISGATCTVVYDGTAWQLTSVSGNATAGTYLAKTGGTMTGDITMTAASVIEAEGAAVTAAATTHIWATDGNTVHIAGATGINDFGTAPQAGAWMKVIFDSTPLLTQSANLNLNAGGANVTMAADDMAFVYADTATQMDVFIIRKSGAAISSTGASGSITASGYTQTTARLLGRTTASTGAIEEMTVGTGLTLSAGSLTATGGITLGTPTATTSGSTIDYTSIPAGTKRITCMFKEVSGSNSGGSTNILIQLGDAGGLETTGYISTTGTDDSTAGLITGPCTHTIKVSGQIIISLENSSVFSWVATSGWVVDTTGVYTTGTSGGWKSLSQELDRVRITLTNAFTFDAGEVNISRES